MWAIRASVVAGLFLAVGVCAAFVFRKERPSATAYDDPGIARFDAAVERRLSAPAPLEAAPPAQGDSSTVRTIANTAPASSADPKIAREKVPRRNRGAQPVPLLTTPESLGADAAARPPKAEEPTASPIGVLFGPTPADEPPSTPGTRWHVLEDGDTLGRLAELYLGRADRWQEIFDANRSVLLEPDLLPLGRRLRIPPREAIMDAPSEQESQEDEQPGPLVPIRK